VESVLNLLEDYIGLIKIELATDGISFDTQERVDDVLFLARYIGFKTLGGSQYKNGM
jgi:hypothetical protein